MEFNGVAQLLKIEHMTNSNLSTHNFAPISAWFPLCMARYKNKNKTKKCLNFWFTSQDILKLLPSNILVIPMQYWICFFLKKINQYLEFHNWAVLEIIYYIFSQVSCYHKITELIMFPFLINFQVLFAIKMLITLITACKLTKTFLLNQNSKVIM